MYSGIQVRRRGYLPHWEAADGTYFVTFRTADAISEEQLAALRLSRYTPDGKRTQVLANLGRWLDTHPQSGILRQQNAAIVADAIQYRHRREYNLIAWCVMPNHVHLIVQLLAGFRLHDVMRKLKSYTATQINRVSDRSGPVWQREYFDHLVRPGKLDSMVRYVLLNPQRAGLTGWPWVEDCRKHN